MAIVSNFALKPSGPCGCGCPKEGTYRVKAWKSGILCVRNCVSCASCRGRRSKKGGQYDQQSKGAHEISGKRGRTHEEADRFALRWQNKKGRISEPIHRVWEKLPEYPIACLYSEFYPSRLLIFRGDKLAECWKLMDQENFQPFYPNEKIFVQPVFTAFSKVEKDDNVMRPIGDNRPFLARFSVAARRYGLLIFRLDQFEEMHQALGVENGFM